MFAFPSHWKFQMMVSQNWCRVCRYSSVVYKLWHRMVANGVNICMTLDDILRLIASASSEVGHLKSRVDPYIS